MTYIILSFLACAPTHDSGPVPEPEPTRPEPEWIEGICFEERLPLDYDIIQVVACEYYEGHYEVCAANGWRIYEDGTWEPSTCPGSYWKAYVRRW